VFGKMRRRIAERLTQSKQTIPHFYLFTDVDMTLVLKWRQACNEANQCHVTVNDLIVKAAATALREFPEINSHVADDRLVVKSDINIGVAVSVEGGLLVPVIPRADTLDLIEISRLAKKNAANARRGIIDMSVPGTFTVSNLGRLPVTRFVPIINPPECAILGVANTEKRVVPVQDGIAVREMLTLCLACDHRATDGAYAAEFLGAIKEHLEAYALDRRAKEAGQ
jgi:pyruvate dehydrogenase E2 component (dihydrolipoamide acetyltransferase)